MSSESEMDSEGDEDSEEMEMAEQYTGEEEDEPEPNSYEENHIPTSIFLALTPPNVKELEATAEVNMAMNVDVDAPASLDTLINHLDEPTLSHSPSFHPYTLVITDLTFC